MRGFSHGGFFHSGFRVSALNKHGWSPALTTGSQEEALLELSRALFHGQARVRVAAAALARDALRLNDGDADPLGALVGRECARREGNSDAAAAETDAVEHETAPDAELSERLAEVRDTLA